MVARIIFAPKEIAETRLDWYYCRICKRQIAPRSKYVSKSSGRIKVQRYCCQCAERVNLI